MEKFIDTSEECPGSWRVHQGTREVIDDAAEDLLTRWEVKAE